MDTIWIYLAMVAILGLRWFFEQLKRGAERRRQILDGTLDREEEVYQQQEETYYEEPAQAPAPPPLPTNQRAETQQQQQESAPAVPQTLQELFEQRRQEIAKAQREVNKPKPTPQPKQQPAAPAPQQPVVSQPVPTGPNQIELNSPFATDSREKSKAKSRKGIGKLLSDRENVRSAIILNEVIGKPKGL